jgi:hypothetical protein
LNVAAYEASDRAAWDALVATAPMGTLLHSRKFLSYHGDRFEDASIAIRDDAGLLAGVLPAAADPAAPGVVVSHPGATFGGIVHDGALLGGAMVDALAAVADHYRLQGFERLRYRPVPCIYHRRPSADDLYALFRLDATRVRCDLSCAIDLDESGPRSSRRKRGLAKARRSGVEVTAGAGLVEELWPVIEATLAERHGTRPVHTAAEMLTLVDRFANDIEIVVARHAGAAVGGVVLFCGPRVVKAQYIASTPGGNEVGALDGVFERCLDHARARGARYFDFGTSNREAGRVLNAGLYDFKAQFGGSGVAYEFYELELSAATPKPVSP